MRPAPTRVAIMATAGFLLAASVSLAAYRLLDQSPRSGSASPVRGPDHRTYDDLLFRVAKRVPEFAGVFTGGDGLHILLTIDRPKLAERAQHLLGAIVDGHLADRRVVVERAKYSFAQLHGWHEQLIDILALDGVVFTDIDEPSNRIVIGAEDPGGIAETVQTELLERGIPSEAVRLEQSAPIEGEAETE